jgi:hypothetical protein
MKMGWRQGRSIRDSHADSLYGMPFVFNVFVCLVSLAILSKCGPSFGQNSCYIQCLVIAASVLANYH